MIVNYKDYTVEIINDAEYTIGSVDNLRNYSIVYTSTQSNENFKCGIIIKQNGDTLASALICDVGLVSIIHDNSYLIKDNSLFICCEAKLYSLSLPELNMNWEKQCDISTCFGIYQFDDDIIVHGETIISRITKSGLIKWQFNARDIFVTMDGQKAFEIIDDIIKLRDFENYEYLLDKNGNEI